MSGWFMRRVTTGSGATAVQIVHKRGGEWSDRPHRLRARRGAAGAADAHGCGTAARRPARAGAGPHPPQLADPGSPVVDATGSLILWEALFGLYDTLGFAAVADGAFRALVLGRIVEPTSKLDTVRVLDELRVASRSLRGFGARVAGQAAGGRDIRTASDNSGSGCAVPMAQPTGAFRRSWWHPRQRPSSHRSHSAWSGRPAAAPLGRSRQGRSGCR